MSMSRAAPDADFLATIGPQQLGVAESRYHALLAAVRHEYHIAPRPAEPGGLHVVSFAKYTDRTLETFQADMSDPRKGTPQYVPSSICQGKRHCWTLPAYCVHPTDT